MRKNEYEKDLEKLINLSSSDAQRTHIIQRDFEEQNISENSKSYMIVKGWIFEEKDILGENIYYLTHDGRSHFRIRTEQGRERARNWLVPAAISFIISVGVLVVEHIFFG